MTETQMHSYIIGRYNDIIQMPQLRKYYGESDYMNFGFWEDDTRSQKEACDNLMERLLAFLPDRSGTILDVACGKGATTAYLRKYFPPQDITAINISERQLDIARTNAPGCRFLLMNSTELAFPDSSFDNVICVEAMFHFYTRRMFLVEARRVLKPGGRLVVSDVLMTREGEDRRESRTIENYIPNLEEYREVFRETGFRELELVDATEQCWRRHYRHAVHYFHERFLNGEIDRNELEFFLQHTYGRVPDMRFYLLAAARK